VRQLRSRSALLSCSLFMLDRPGMSACLAMSYSSSRVASAAAEPSGEVQEQIHGGEKPPSEQVIDMHRDRFGDEYRIETDGPHPVELLRVAEGARRA
jgi:hypothetical protein